MARGTESFRFAAICALASAGAAAVVAAMLSGDVALAEESASGPPADSEPVQEDIPAVDPAPTYVPGTMYAADPDALPYEALDATEKARADAAGEWAETGNGHEVQQAWSAVSAAMARQAEVQKAEHEAGVNGLGDVGVE